VHATPSASVVSAGVSALAHETPAAYATSLIASSTFAATAH
jgi:hypothetical protein